MVHHMFGECFSLYLRSLRLRLVPDDTIIVVDDNTEPLRFPAFMSEIASDVARSDKCLRNLRRAVRLRQAFSLLATTNVRHYRHLHLKRLSMSSVPLLVFRCVDPVWS